NDEPFFFTRNTNNTRIGYTVGGGVEYAITPNWTVKGEALYVNLEIHKLVLYAVIHSRPLIFWTVLCTLGQQPCGRSRGPELQVQLGPAAACRREILKSRRKFLAAKRNPAPAAGFFVCEYTSRLCPICVAFSPRCPENCGEKTFLH